MAKYIKAEFYKKYSKLFPELKRKTSVVELWNLVADSVPIEASIEIEKVRSQLKFELNGETHRIVRPTEDIVKIVDDDTKAENYEVLIVDALDYILQNKLLKPKKKTKKKEKN